MDCGNRAGIDDSGKGTQWHEMETLCLIAAMGQVVLEPDTITYNLAIIACEKGAEWQKALHLEGMRCWTS